MKKILSTRRKFFSAGFLLLLYPIFIFSRSYLGIYISGYRIGEFYVAFSLIGSVILLVFFQKPLKERFNSKIINSYNLLVVYFFLSVLIKRDSLLDVTIYRNSSFMWSLFYIFLGVFIFDNVKITKKVLIFLNFNLLLAYYLQIIYFYKLTLLYGDLAMYSYEIRILNLSNNKLLDFFIINSDKFETYKGSGFLLFYVLITHLTLNKNEGSRLWIIFFVLVSGLFIPVFLVRSRTAAAIAICYFMFNLYKSRSILFQPIRYLFFTILIFVSCFIFSTNLLYEETLALNNSSGVVEQLVTGRNTPQGDRAFLEFENGRLYSSDGNLNWRLQIWQDVFSDMYTEKDLIFGQGFSGTIRSMENSLPGYYGRTGLDGLNTNVHNFIVNMLARGGIFYVSGYFVFLYLLVKKDLKNKRRSTLLYFLIPLLIVVLFDAAMENVHYPLFLYLYFGLHFSQKDH